MDDGMYLMNSDTLVSYLALIGAALLVVGWVWAMTIAFRDRHWWWAVVILPLTYFFSYPLYWARNGRKAAGPGMLWLLTWLTMFGTVAINGDLAIDKHPAAVGRTFVERFAGCAGRDVYRPGENGQDADSAWLRGFKFIGLEPGNLQDALSAARLAALTYRSDEAILKKTDEWGYPRERVRLIRKNGLFVLILGGERSLLVAFRGTSEPKNWLSNLKIYPTDSPWGRGRVHKGFLDATEAIWPSMRAQLLQLRDADQQIWFIGHSLGGALANLAALRFAVDDGLRVAGVYTFGQPAVGNKQFTKHVEEELGEHYYRFVINVDEVVGAIWSMAHAGNLRYFDTEGRLHLGPPPYVQSLRDSVCGPFYEDEKETIFWSHQISNYIYLVDRAGRESAIQ